MKVKAKNKADANPSPIARKADLSFFMSFLIFSDILKIKITIQ
jgi:hypothetical protein